MELESPHPYIDTALLTFFIGRRCCDRHLRPTANAWMPFWEDHAADPPSSCYPLFARWLSWFQDRSSLGGTVSSAAAPDCYADQEEMERLWEDEADD